MISESRPYPSSTDLEKDKLYFLKKMEWPVEKLDSYLARPRREHADFASDTTSPFLVVLRFTFVATRRALRLFLRTASRLRKLR